MGFPDGKHYWQPLTWWSSRRLIMQWLTDAGNVMEEQNWWVKLEKHFKCENSNCKLQVIILQCRKHGTQYCTPHSQLKSLCYIPVAERMTLYEFSLYVNPFLSSTLLSSFFLPNFARTQLVFTPYWEAKIKNLSWEGVIPNKLKTFHCSRQISIQTSSSSRYQTSYP